MFDIEEWGFLNCEQVKRNAEFFEYLHKHLLSTPSMPYYVVKNLEQKEKETTYI